MASAERIQLISCPGCSERVIAPPPESIGVWQCPFCRRRFRRRLHSASSSGTIPCVNLFSRHPWPPHDWPADSRRSLLDPARLGSLVLTAYAAVLFLVMAGYHVVALLLASLWLVVQLPLMLWESATLDDAATEDEPERHRLREFYRAWMPYVGSSDPDVSIGPMLREQDAPGIFVVVAEMARKVGVRAPDEVRLTYLPCCGVLEQRAWAGLRPRRRVLVLGLPLLSVLSVEELRAAVAHELAHLSRGDAALAFVLSHFLDALEQSIERGSNRRCGWINPNVIFAWLVRGLFRVLSSPLSRYQEYRADGVSASICGGDVVAHSLRNAAIVQPIFKEVLCDYHPVVIAEANLYQFFRAAWDAIDEPLKEEIKESLVNEERLRLFALHPTLRCRLKRLERFAKHRDPDSRPARRLLLERRQLEEVLHNYIYRTHGPRIAVYEPGSD